MWKNIIILSIGFFASILLLGWFCYSYYSQLKSYYVYAGAVEHSYKVLSEAQYLESHLKDAETAQRGFLLTEDSTFLKPYFLFYDEIEPTFNKLLVLTKDNPRQRRNLKELKFTMIRRMEYLREGLILFKSEKKIFARKLRQGRDLMDQCREILLKIRNEEQRLLIIRSSYEQKFKNSSSWYSIGAFIFAFIVFIITFILIIREFRLKMVYQRMLEQKIEELNNSNAELEQIAFVASHDFQEPIRKILTFSDLLQTKYFSFIPIEGQYIFERIKYASQQLKSVLDSLINFTTSVRSNEERKELSLNEIIQNVKLDIQANYPTREINLTIEGNLPSIIGYPNQIRLLFHCLFSNTLKFSKAEGPIKISITARSANAEEIKLKFKNNYASERYLKIAVEDQGIGFQNEFAQKIFVLFQRLHNSDSEFEGKGIGLAIVKRIMHNHHGYVNAYGELNKGATFNLFFPAT